MGHRMQVALVVAALLSVGVGFGSRVAFAQTPSGGTTPSVACIDGASAASAALCSAYHGGLATITTRTPGGSGNPDTGMSGVKGTATYDPIAVKKEIGGATPALFPPSTAGVATGLTDKIGGGSIVNTPPPAPPPPCVKDPKKPTAQRVCPPPEPKKE
jgi:hypothetical protein